MEFIDNFFLLSCDKYSENDSQNLIKWYNSKNYLDCSELEYFEIKEIFYQTYNLLSNEIYIKSTEKIAENIPVLRYYSENKIDNTISDLELIHTKDKYILKHNLIQLLIRSNIQFLKNNYPFDDTNNFLFRKYIVFDFFIHILYIKTNNGEVITEPTIKHIEYIIS